MTQQIDDAIPQELKQEFVTQVLEAVNARYYTLPVVTIAEVGFDFQNELYPYSPNSSLMVSRHSDVLQVNVQMLVRPLRVRTSGWRLSIVRQP